MSLIPGEKLHYAETHFKFKLPWSLLYRPWPEILVDAPFQFVPSAEPTLWIVVRDAHRFPTLIESISIDIEHAVQAAQRPNSSKKSTCKSRPRNSSRSTPSSSGRSSPAATKSAASSPQGASTPPTGTLQTT